MTIRIIFLFFILSVYNLNADLGKKYLWPTNASEYMTSSFCEYRTGHYHSAIDIKTWNQEGYPCYAIENGTIYKVRISPFGYGKVIYLKLDDGNFAVYAHLQKFNDKIENEIHKKQIENKRYTLNWNPKNWRVKKGDIIAYSGQTGIGVPHLHFEIRDPKERPMNPLHFYNNIKDNISPILKSLLVIPLSKKSKVNGSIKPQDYSLSYINKNVYIIKSPIKTTGLIGLAIEGYDKANDVFNKFAFYKTTLFINGKKHFELQYDFFDFAITNQVDIEIYYPQRAKNRNVFHKLFIDTYNKLPFYDRSLGDGKINTGINEIPFKIEVSDFWGNTSYILGTLLGGNIEPAQMKLMNKMNDLAYLQLELPHRLKDLKFSSSIDNKVWKNVNYFEVLESKFSATHQTMLVKITLHDSADKYIKTSVVTHENEAIETNATFEKELNDEVNLNIENLGKYIALQFSPVKDMAGLQLVLKNEINNHNFRPQIINDYYEEVIDANYFNSRPLKVDLLSDQTSIIDTTLIYYPIFPKQIQQFGFYGDSCQIFTGVESVYDTLMFGVSHSKIDNFTNGIPILSSLFHINSSPQVLKSGIDLKLKYDSTYINPERLGLYQVNGENSISFVSNKIDSLNHLISGKIKSFGKFIVAADTIAPHLRIVYPIDNQKLAKLDKIKFSAFDELSGISSDKNLSITFDDQFVLPEWDPERDIITGEPHWNVESGEHEIIIQVRDLAGNISEKRLNITIE